MLGGLLAVALAAAPTTPAPPATPPASQSSPASTPPQTWLVSDTKVAFTPTPIVFPLKAGVLSATNHKEASHPGQNLDNAIEYHSPDQAIFGTVYIYFPGLSHAGLAAIAEDSVIRDSWPDVTGGETRVVAAGGKEGVAIRASYGRYHGDLASSASYLKAGRWLITLRVSGPMARKAEVEAAMDALLAGITFGQHAPARPASLLSVRECPQPRDERPAKALPDKKDASVAAVGFLATLDGAGMEAKDSETGEPAILPSRVPTDLCRAQLKAKGRQMILLRGVDGEPISIDGRTVRAALLSDSGRIMEVDHDAKLGGYVLLYHDLGETDVLGTYDAIPSDKQLADIIDGTDRDGGRIRVPVHFHAEKGPEIFLPAIAPAAPAASPAQASPPPPSSR
jgi:hypothetical protein